MRKTPVIAPTPPIPAWTARCVCPVASSRRRCSAREPEPQMQLTMFTPLSQKIVDRLRDADLNNLTPLEALNLLHELKKQL